jgi:hypothetical protein
MKTMRTRRSWLAFAFVLAALSGCSMPGAGPHRMHHAGAGESTSAQGRHNSQGMGMGQEDMRAMCSGVHDRLRSARSADERAAIMQEHMRGLSPEMRKKMDEHMRSQSPEDRAQRCMQPW